MHKDDRELIERTPAQFFFEVGFAAAYAQALIANDMKPPFTLTDAIVEHAWEIAGEAHDDPEEFDRYLSATRLEALQAQPVGEDELPAAHVDGYVTAFYELAGVMGISARADTPVNVWRNEMLPRLHAALTASPPVVTPKWDVCRNCVDGSKAGQTCTVCEGRGHVPFVPTPASPPVVEREAINRALILAVEDFINEPPRSYDIEPMEVRDYRHSLYRIWSPLRDAILALTPVEGVGESSTVIEREWEALANRPCETTGAEDMEPGCCAPCRARAVRSTPVAQGDEVRDALDDGVSTLAAVRATTISDEEWHASRLHFRDLCAQTIARMNTALATLTKGARDAG